MPNMRQARSPETERFACPRRNPVPDGAAQAPTESPGPCRLWKRAAPPPGGCAAQISMSGCRAESPPLYGYGTDGIIARTAFRQAPCLGSAYWVKVKVEISQTFTFFLITVSPSAKTALKS